MDHNNDIWTEALIHNFKLLRTIVSYLFHYIYNQYCHPASAWRCILGHPVQGKLQSKTFQCFIDIPQRSAKTNLITLKKNQHNMEIFSVQNPPTKFLDNSTSLTYSKHTHTPVVIPYPTSAALFMKYKIIQISRTHNGPAGWKKFQTPGWE